MDKIYKNLVQVQTEEVEMEVMPQTLSKSQCHGTQRTYWNTIVCIKSAWNKGIAKY